MVLVLCDFVINLDAPRVLNETLLPDFQSEFICNHAVCVAVNIALQNPQDSCI